MKAILSVYDKTGVIELGKSLSDSGLEIISTGGTYKQLSDSNMTGVIYLLLPKYLACLFNLFSIKTSQSCCS